MKEGCMIVKCERCGSESQLMMRSIRSNAFLCPACMENEIECQLAKPVIKICREPSGTDCLYPYVSNKLMISAN
jgi:recombinational DNA repair protein (RecF pathway)